MKRIFRVVSVFLAVCLFASTAFALSDRGYKVLMKDKKFAAADNEMNQAYKEAKEVLDKEEFENLRQFQRQWLASGRDNEARAWMKEENLPFVDAYTRATIEQTKAINNWVYRHVDEVVDDDAEDTEEW